ncbi:MAG: hypothetical protein ACUVQ6_03105 [Dissulfurimicrobium sp.]|uniref:hypothetical protein n=1 Tax=Dissulfurimicrobium sp. TaxID=2022436 RepID=UPI0040497BBD
MHLEPLELEIVMGGASIDDEVRILDLSFEKDPVLGFENAMRSMHPDLIGFTEYRAIQAL